VSSFINRVAYYWTQSFSPFGRVSCLRDTEGKAGSRGYEPILTILEQDILGAWGIRRAVPQGTSVTSNQQQATSSVSTASEDSVVFDPQEP
jgi:hypothetical protein